MPFTPATGSNSDVANSYVDLDYASQFFSLRGVSTWTGSDQDKQAALVKATDYIEQNYGQRWIGANPRTTGLSWPRYCTAYGFDDIPDNLKKATCELALTALTTDLSPAITRERAIKREMVGGAIDTEYFETGTQPTLFPAVTGYLAPLLSGSSLNRKVVRV